MDQELPRSWRPPVGSLVGLSVLLLVFLGGILIFFRYLAVARENARRLRCEDNLRQWGQSFAAYQSDNEALPPIGLGPDQATWALFVWPYRDVPSSEEISRRAEQGQPWVPDRSLVDAFDYGVSCFASSNAAVVEKMTWPRFFCPTRRAGTKSVVVETQTPADMELNHAALLTGQPSDYAAVGPADDVNPFSPRSRSLLVVGEVLTDGATKAQIRSRTTLEDVPDGLTATAIVGEKHVLHESLGNTDLSVDGGDGPAMLGRPAYFQRRMGDGAGRSLASGPNDRTATELFGSWHVGVCQFLFADGHVQAVRTNTDRGLLTAYANRNDSEN